MLDLYDKIINELLNPWTSFYGLNPTSSSIPESSYKIPNVHAPNGFNYAKKDNDAW